MVFGILVSLDGNRDANRSAVLRTGFLQVPAVRLMVHPVIRGQQECRVGRGSGRFTEELIQSREMLLGFLASGGQVCIG